MADIQILGHITNIQFKTECILLFIDEYKKGYRKSNGEIVDDKIVSWKCIFSGNESKRGYINKYFNRGSLVQIKGEVFPYAIENGKMVDGVSVIVQTINLHAYPRQMIKQERRMIKESQEHSTELPNLKGYNEADF